MGSQTGTRGRKKSRMTHVGVDVLVQCHGDKDAIPDVRPRAVSQVMIEPCRLDALGVLVGDTEGVVHLRWVAMSRARYPRPATRVPLWYCQSGYAVWRIWRRTEAVLEPVVLGTGKDMPSGTSLRDRAV